MMTDEAKCKVSGFHRVKRVRYFNGMLMTEADFRDEQMYHLEKRRMLNRYLHGWGIVCGLDVRENNNLITISPGFALDCHGNEIWLDETVQLGPSEMVEAKQSRGECTDEETTQEPESFFIAICYRKKETNQVSVYAPDGCDEQECAPSRVADGYCIRIFDERPPQPNESWINENLPDNPDSLCEAPLPCPADCPSEHCIILGRITLDRDEGGSLRVASVEKNGHRTQIWSARMWQYVISSLLAEQKKIDSNTTERWYTNPLEVLCRYFKNEFNLFGERAQEAQQPSALENRLKSQEAEIKSLKKTIAEMQPKQQSKKK